MSGLFFLRVITRWTEGHINKELLVQSNTNVGQELHNELQLAKDTLEHLPLGVTIFGSARIEADNIYYASTVDIARRIAAAGIPILSGGGPGIMQAANKGAQLAGGVSVGLNIVLPFEQKPNAFQNLSVTFEHFSSRKVSLTKYARAFVVMPGGLGTLDELSEVLTLMQCGKIPKAPFILYGSRFWAGLLDWMRAQLVSGGLVRAADLRLMHVVDTVDEAMDALASVMPQDTLSKPLAAA